MNLPQRSIQIDDDVFELLQKHATPLVDLPNDVLRRLLFENKGVTPQGIEVQMTTIASSTEHPVSADSFVTEVLRKKFGSGFRRIAPYRMMFESSNAIVYFQNFNKEAVHLWYRINENPWRILSTSQKETWICLTNPAERFAYTVPVLAIKDQIMQSKWSRPYLEVNIDPANSRWTEFDWRLDEYLETF
jgi:hypothetical protein